MPRPRPRECPSEPRRAADRLADLEQIDIAESLICLFIGLDGLLTRIESEVENNIMERA